MTPKDQTYVAENGGRLVCRRCGKIMRLALPMPIMQYSATLLGFSELHKDCERKEEEAAHG